jgi:glyoxylase-like metal-dependent hydrolase (beta-lactamase superfamily II)
MAPLNIPQSNSTVRLRAIDAKTSMSVHSRRFIKPEIAGFDTLNLTSVCFLIDNHNLNQRILFDCGARKDFENYSPTTKARLNAIIKGIKIEADVNDILVDAGIHLDSLDSMIWSHWHWDHHGAAEKFPSSVEVVVGPGFKENFMPGYPTNEEAPLLDANFK